MFLSNIKRQMGIALVSGLVFSGKIRKTYHLSAKHNWNHCQNGFGGQSESLRGIQSCSKQNKKIFLVLVKNAAVTLIITR